MKKMTRTLTLLLALIMLLAMAACGQQVADPTPTPKDDAPDQEKILRVAESFAYNSVDAHKEYYGWYTSIYGVTETLFRMDDSSAVQPCLAESAAASEDGLTWTVVLKDAACFSNGEPVTADMVVRNIRRLAENNERFAYLSDFAYEAVDEKSLTITTPEIYPTMLNVLTSPEMAILDLDSITDFDNAIIATGPFVLTSFEPMGTVEVAKNESYWGGEVKLDGAVIYYMQDDDSKLMAMQNGEIDGYTSVTAAALEIFSADPDTYKVVAVPATRLQFIMLNENTMSDAVRQAVNLVIDKEAIAEYLNGTVTAATGPFGSSTAYGQVSVPAVDVEAAKALLESDGYVMGADGIYAKDGQPLNLNLCYYAARSLDTLAVLIQEQLGNIGVGATLTVEEDPDSTYIATGDFDLALYCMIADTAGDPYYFIDAVLRQDSRWAIAGFHSDECEALINELQYETDPARRAELSNQILQIAIDDNAISCVGLFNKTTVMKPGVSGIAENCPFDFYRLDANTDIA